MNTELLREWLTLDERKRQLKADLEDVEEQIAQKIDAVTDEFINSGVNNIRIDGRTVYVACDRWPKVKGDKSVLVAAMKANSLGDFVKEDFNTQSLRGVMNEWIHTRMNELTPEERAVFDVNDAIPEALRDSLGVSEVYSIKSRKS
jgi:hypothetical protein